MSVYYTYSMTEHRAILPIEKKMRVKSKYVWKKNDQTHSGQMTGMQGRAG